MISAEQNLRSTPPAKHFGAGILRAIEQFGFTKALVHRGFAITEHAFPQARDGIDDDGRGQFASAEHEVADRDFVVGKMLGHALVDAFVAAADEQEFVELGVVAREGLVELATLRREKHDTAAGIVFRAPSKYRFHGFKDGLALQQHAFPAPEWPVIDGAMAVARPIAQVVDVDVEESASPCALDDTVVEGTAKEFGEDREDVKSHLSYLVLAECIHTNWASRTLTQSGLNLILGHRSISRFRSPIMNAHNFLCISAVALTVSVNASAATITTDLYNAIAPSGATTIIDLTGITTPSQTGFSGPGYSVSFTGVGAAQGVVQGFASSVHAVPVAGAAGSTPRYLTGGFGSPLTTNIANSGNYLSTGLLGSIAITFTNPQTSFALLWGSIDTLNYLSFNDAASTVVTGALVQSLTPGFVSNGFQGIGGSAWVLVTTDTPFTTVTAGSGTISFELAGMVGASPTPEPSTFLLAGSMLGLLGLAMRRRKSR